ncbi:phosphoglycerate mutase [Apiospora aurea]|uniref:Phosphoglycerate mutase n=1 Tax=Apiospora aurea TaxID=335848 RepID=A0ABR1Q3J7_9PEZI
MGKYAFSLIDNVFADKVRADPNNRKPPTLIRQPQLGLMPDFDGVGSSCDKGILQPWARIRSYVDKLNRENKQGAKYKVIFVLRHGYSLHNYIEKGVKRFNEAGEEVRNDWRKEVSLEALRGAGCEIPRVLEDYLRGGDPNAAARVSLYDAALLPKEITLQIRDSGVTNNDAEDLGKEWFNWVEIDKFPLPDAIYTSPLSRCLETTKKVYEPAFEAHAGGAHKFRPIIMENLREKGNGDACNYRSTKEQILDQYPNYATEPDFAQKDEYEYQIQQAKDGEPTESNKEIEDRMRKVLNAIFDNDETSVVSLTTHSFSIGSLTKVIGNARMLDEGDITAFLVKAVPH